MLKNIFFMTWSIYNMGGFLKVNIIFVLNSSIQFTSQLKAIVQTMLS